MFVAEDEGVILGWIHCFKARRLASANFFEIGGMVVCPAKRKQGIGRKMVHYVLQKHPGKCRVRCNSKRKEAHAFYEKLGFTINKNQHVFEMSSEPD